MTNANIMRRLERLENAGDGSDRVLLMERNETESYADAEARWRHQHPGEHVPAAALCVVIIRFANDLPTLGGHS